MQLKVSQKVGDWILKITASTMKGEESGTQSTQPTVVTGTEGNRRLDTERGPKVDRNTDGEESEEVPGVKEEVNEKLQ